MEASGGVARLGAVWEGNRKRAWRMHEAVAAALCAKTRIEVVTPLAFCRAAGVPEPSMYTTEIDDDAGEESDPYAVPSAPAAAAAPDEQGGPSEAGSETRDGDADDRPRRAVVVPLRTMAPALKLSTQLTSRERFRDALRWALETA